MHRPEAIPWPTPDPMAANQSAKPAPTAERAGIHTLPSAACAAVGAMSAATLSAAVAWLVGGATFGTAGTKVVAMLEMSAMATRSIAAVKIMDRGDARLGCAPHV